MAFGGGGIGGGGLDGGAFGGGAFGGGGAAFGGGRFGAAKKANHESNMSSALVSAAMRGDEIEVLKQLDAGVSIEEVDKQTGITALMAACAHGNESIVDILLQRNVRIDNERQLPGIAAGLFHADPDMQCRAVFFACARGHRAIVQKLLERGAANAYSVGARHGLKHKYSLLAVAATNHHEDLVDMLLEGAKTKTVISALGYTVSYGKPFMVKKLLLAFPQIDVKEATVISAGMKNAEIVRLLLEHPTADVNYVSKNFRISHGLTALHQALAPNCAKLEIVQLLLNSGASVNVTDVNGRNALHHACVGKGFGFGKFGSAQEQPIDRLPIIEALLPHIHDIDAQDKEGTTALHIACNHYQPEFAELLIRRGANHQITDNAGDTPFEQCDDRNSRIRLRAAVREASCMLK